MTDDLRSIVLGTAGLSVAGVVALLLTFARTVTGDAMELRAAARVAVVAILLQAVHFAEELSTGFHQRFPELLGLRPWSTRFFVSFNLFWLAIWSVSAWGVTARQRVALAPLWFLSIACVANGLAHPSFSIRTGGYFPGLVTSPFLGVVGLLLLRRLYMVTSERPPSLRSPCGV